MPTIKYENKELVLSPLSFEDMAAVEFEALCVAIAKAKARIADMDALRIGSDEDRKAVLDAASDEGAAEQDFIRGFIGRSYVLWLSARQTQPSLTIEEFRKKCPALNHRKAEELVRQVMGEAENKEPRPLPAHEKYKDVESQEARREGIFNALCEGEGISPMDLKAMAETDIYSLVPLFCKYAGTNKCDPDKLKERVEEYCVQVAKAR